MAFYNMVIFACLCGAFATKIAYIHTDFIFLVHHKPFLIFCAYVVVSVVVAGIILLSKKNVVYCTLSFLTSAGVLVSWVTLLGVKVGLFGWLVLPAVLLLAFTLTRVGIIALRAGRR